MANASKTIEIAHSVGMHRSVEDTDYPFLACRQVCAPFVDAYLTACVLLVASLCSTERNIPNGMFHIFLL